MIKIDGREIKIAHFPDGAQKLNISVPYIIGVRGVKSEITWIYEKEEELSTLIYSVKHLKDHDVDRIGLVLKFVPNGRMDRTKYDNEVFTLKYFADVINWLDFDYVEILDPHSNVVPALFNKVTINNPTMYIVKALKEISEDVVIYYPDISAMKKYSEMLPNIPFVYGNKKRNWEDGRILGIDIINDYDIDLNEKTVLMVDDLISYGGSMFFGAKKLKELGVGKVYAYATHTENSVLDKEKGTLIKSLEDGTVERLFTTDSLFTGTHEKIEVLEFN